MKAYHILIVAGLMLIVAGAGLALSANHVAVDIETEPERPACECQGAAPSSPGGTVLSRPRAACTAMLHRLDAVAVPSCLPTEGETRIAEGPGETLVEQVRVRINGEWSPWVDVIADDPVSPVPEDDGEAAEAEETVPTQNPEPEPLWSPMPLQLLRFHLDIDQ